MFHTMQFPISDNICREIFESIDIDGGGSISLPELMSDYHMVLSRSIEDLKIEEANKRREAMRSGPSHVSDDELRKI